MTKKEIKEKIEDQLIWDDRVLSADIHIEVSEDMVKLTGEVPDFSSRIAAEEDALTVSGMHHVENNLKVTYPEAIVKPDDEQIKKSLEDLLKLDDRINSSNVKVNVNMGTVTFSGIVDAKWKKDVVKGYAYHIAGVTDVKETLTVNPANQRKDEDIKQEIEKAFLRNAVLESENINVNVEKGKVVLSGTAGSHLARLSARDIANYTSGVIEVDNEIKLNLQLQQ